MNIKTISWKLIIINKLSTNTNYQVLYTKVLKSTTDKQSRNYSISINTNYQILYTLALKASSL